MRDFKFFLFFSPNTRRWEKGESCPPRGPVSPRQRARRQREPRRHAARPIVRYKFSFTPSTETQAADVGFPPFRRSFWAAPVLSHEQASL